ncbi:MAG: hypothetical protein JW849_00300 [Phycisphaerae bacterium]|nr:hypothetical protein [Phycisphaerae bacterium]
MESAAKNRFARGNFLRAVWQPAGVVYLCFCLAGLTAGLWLEKITPTFTAESVPLPTLQTLAVAQVFFFLLVYPIVLVRRREKRGDWGLGTRDWELGTGDWGLGTGKSDRDTNSEFRDTNSVILIELLGMFLAATPLYILAAWLGDATGRDVFRAVLAVAAVCPLGVLAGRLFRGPAWRGGAMLGLLVIVLGLPGAWYICVDFLGVSGDWARKLSPLLQTWTTTAARQTAWLPQPTWAWLAWPILAAAGGVGMWTCFTRKGKSNTS